MVTRRDYTAEGVEAARSVLIELVHLLGEYKDDIVLIGGWIPEVLLPLSDLLQAILPEDTILINQPQGAC